MRLRFLVSGLVAVATIAAVAEICMGQDGQRAASSGPAVAVPHRATTAKGLPVEESEGERVFNQNCSRCHNAPEGFSPRIAGTIARHMRVRANLSRHDEQVLLHFLNP